MTVTPLFPGEHIDAMLNRFKKVIGKAGIVNEARTRSRFVAPCIKRRSKSARARKRLGPTHGNPI